MNPPSVNVDAYKDMIG